MTPPQTWEQASRIFAAARAVSPDEWEAYLERTCDDVELRAEVRALLHAHAVLESGVAGGFLDPLNPEQVAELLLDDEVDAGADPDELCAGEMLGRYRIVRQLGRGGMGVVYLALEPHLERPTALKLLPRRQSLDPAARRRFMVEARAASALDHPNVGTVYEVGETGDGRIFLAMACYEGETLRQILDRGPLPIDQAREVAIQIAEGLRAAHARGIVHRDIKPGNVILTDTEPTRHGTTAPVVKIVDFGIAKIAGDALTEGVLARGTVAYMSPEQTRGEAVDARSDLWSLGVVLYEMLTGRRPFAAVHDQALIYSIRHDEPDPVRRLRPEVPDRLARVVARCLKREPAARYPNADALLADLRGDGEVVRSRAGGSASRRRMGVRTGLVTALLFALVTGAGLWLDGGGLHRWRGAAAGHVASANPAPRLAVLPLDDRTDDPADAYLADALTRELIAQISTLPDLRVIAASSTQGYRRAEASVSQVGRELEVQAVLAGTVEKNGDRFQIAVRLFDSSTGGRIWEEDYDADLVDLLTVQARITQRVADALHLRRGADLADSAARARTADREAYELYLRGRYLLGNFNAASFARARDFFLLALERDPGFANAWSGLADSYDRLAGQSALSGDDAFPRARAAAERALSLDPSLAEAHVSLGNALAWYYWQTQAAGTHFRRAIELDPSSASAHQSYAAYLRNLGRFEQALAEIQIAESLDPLSAFSHIERGIILYVSRRYDEAIEQYERTLRAAPTFTYANFFIALAHAQKGDYDAGLAALQVLDPEREHPDAVTVRALIHAMTGRRDEARRGLIHLDQLAVERPVSSFQRAAVHVHLDEHDQALALLEKAIEERAWQVRLLRVEPIFDPLRSDPRFQALLAKLGLGA